jgi:hypothetical protein
MFAGVHREVGYVLASGNELTREEYRRLQIRYDMATVSSVEIPERTFLPQKKRHLRKIAISRHLDSHPGSTLIIVKFKLWLRDNFSSGKSS